MVFARVRVFAVATVVVLGGAACGGSAGSDSGGSGAGGATTEITISASGADTYTFFAALQLAIDKGWFEEEGLAITLLSGEGGGNTLRVVTTGSAQMAIAGATSVVLAAQDPEQNMDVIGAWYQVNDFLWLTPDENATLENATLGFTSAGSSTELMIKGMIEEQPDAGIEGVAVGGVGDNWTVAKAGRITGGFSLPPYSNQLIAEEGAQVLVEGRDILGDLPADLVVVNKDFAEENPDALEAFWRVTDRAFTYVQESPDEAATDMAKLLPVDQEYIQQALEDYSEGFDIAIDAEVLENLSNLMVKTETISEPIDWGTLMNQEFLPEDARADL